MKFKQKLLSDRVRCFSNSCLSFRCASYSKVVGICFFLRSKNGRSTTSIMHSWKSAFEDLGESLIWDCKERNDQWIQRRFADRCSCFASKRTHVWNCVIFSDVRSSPSNFRSPVRSTKGDVSPMNLPLMSGRNSYLPATPSSPQISLPRRPAVELVAIICHFLSLWFFVWVLF